MTIIRHEWKQGRTSLAVWTAGIGGLIAICIFLFPEMKGEMESVSDIFASMGSFTAAFGMDRLSFGTLIGFYGVECGNILGLGGALFAAFMAVNVLSKEEKDGTAEFLLTHPVSRARVLTEKLIAVLLQILALNVIVLALSLGSIVAIGEAIPWKELLLMHLSNLLLQVELAGLCFGLSAFLRRGSVGAGLGVAAMMYFLNIIANISADAECLKYVTPFGYAEAADIVSTGTLDGGMILLGMIYAAAAVAVGYVHYCRKDIR